MNYFILENSDFNDFIKNSTIKMTSNIHKKNSDILEMNVKSPLPYIVKSFIDKFKTLTVDEKIIWHKFSDGFYVGIVIKRCVFSNYKIIIERKDLQRSNIPLFNKLKNQGDKFKISLLKNALANDKADYIFNLTDCRNELTDFFNILEKRIVQDRN